MNKLKALIFIVISGGIALVFYRAGEGDPVSAAFAGAIATILIIAIAFALFIGVIWAVSKAQQVAFTSNARENLQIMAAMTTTQNRQNQMLTRQVTQKQLPPPVQALVFDEGIFSELDEVN